MYVHLSHTCRDISWPDSKVVSLSIIIVTALLMILNQNIGIGWRSIRHVSHRCSLDVTSADFSVPPWDLKMEEIQNANRKEKANTQPLKDLHRDSSCDCDG